MERADTLLRSNSDYTKKLDNLNKELEEYKKDKI